ncbi:uncharacterized protein PITG_11741 [Phytophthora infestans T30-4]|uniref:Trimethylguanosine synthase n=1 Tax=Phytophthora infestans (strain T30-4) TaxID=403677 RepID=D0NIF9_PHYIT|nr:uncharacterized protein PITG_11741 [Phytophthora infestans T30-4]EEY59244.1 conserved hypothetical protein [Phytophthora infestans T30-4]|eukprot:XP_002901258.1 conserved hypothetical protein [Phytophthora infestans T30-4]
MEVPGEPPSHGSTRPMAATARVIVAPVTHLGIGGRQRSSSLDSERLWRPASGFASKQHAELEAKRLHKERQLQRDRRRQEVQAEKRKHEAELAKGPKPNDHVIVEEGEWKTVVSHGRRAHNDRRAAHATTAIFLPLSLGPSALKFSNFARCHDEMKAADVASRKRRQQMRRRRKTSSQRAEAKSETENGRLADNLHVDDAVAEHNGRQARGNSQNHKQTGAMHPPDYAMRKTKSTSPRGNAHQGHRANRRSTSRLDSPQSPRTGSDSHGSPRPRKCGDKRDFFFRNLDYDLRSQLQVDEVAEFSVTDFEMATKISQFVLDLFFPSKDGTTSESGSSVHDDGTATTEKCKKYSLVVTDGTACVGGNVLSFCDFFTHVNAVENDSTRMQMLRHNLQVLQKTNVKCIYANYLDVMLELEQDVVFLDPPWGGPEYKGLDKVDLFLGGFPLHDICSRLKGSAKCVVLKVPSNFDDAKFSQLVPGKVVIRRDLKKMHLVLLDFR